MDETRSKFSLFGADSLPKKNWEVDKRKYGIATEVSDAQKLKEMRIISMESVYKKIEDPMERFQRERMEAMARADTMVVLDSAAVMARSRGEDDIKNIDQMIYLHHFGKYLPRRGASGDLFREDLKADEEKQEEENRKLAEAQAAKEREELERQKAAKKAAPKKKAKKKAKKK